MAQKFKLLHNLRTEEKVGLKDRVIAVISLGTVRMIHCRWFRDTNLFSIVLTFKELSNIVLLLTAQTLFYFYLIIGYSCCTGNVGYITGTALPKLSIILYTLCPVFIIDYRL